MESLRTSLPYPDMPLPISLFEAEIVLTVVLALVIVVFLTYHQWKQMETGAESARETITAKPVETLGVRERFRRDVLALDPASLTFGDEISEILRKFIRKELAINLSPTLTVDELQAKLPRDLGDVFIRIRDIQYAPKGRHSEAGAAVQAHIIALLDRHAI